MSAEGQGEAELFQCFFIYSVLSPQTSVLCLGCKEKKTGGITC
jgi:hypothetical protein